MKNAASPTDNANCLYQSKCVYQSHIRPRSSETPIMNKSRISSSSMVVCFILNGFPVYRFDEAFLNAENGSNTCQPDPVPGLYFPINKRNVKPCERIGPGI